MDKNKIGFGLIMKVYLSLTVMIIAGCSCERPAPTEKPTEKPTEPIEMLWSIPYYYVGSVVESSPLPVNDSLVVMSAGREILLVNHNTGEIQWRAFVDSMTNIQTHLFETDGQHIYATHVQDVRAFDINTGELAWLTDLPDDRGAFASDEISYQDGKLFIAGFHSAYCLNSETGEIIWSKVIGKSTAVNDISKPINNSVYIGTGGKEPQGVFVLNTDSGDSLNKFTLNNGIGKVVMVPLIEDGIMYVGTSWRKPFALEAWDINTNESIWHDDMPNYEFICDHCIIAKDLIVCSLAPYAIGAWDKYTGERQWITYPTQNYNWSRIGYDGTWIYYQHGWKLHVIQPETGNIVYSMRGPDGQAIYQIAVTKDKIFVHGWPENMCFTTYKPE